jgi:hypothetical protein
MSSGKPAHERHAPGDADAGAHEARERGEHWQRFDAELHAKLREKKPKLDELKKKLAERHVSREARQLEARGLLVRRWGSTLAKPDAQAELKLNALRLAQLERLEELAATERIGTQRSELLEKVQKLRERENDRHARSMQAIAAVQTADAASAHTAPATVLAAPAASGGTP